MGIIRWRSRVGIKLADVSGLCKRSCQPCLNDHRPVSSFNLKQGLCSSTLTTKQTEHWTMASHGSLSLLAFFKRHVFVFEMSNDQLLALKLTKSPSQPPSYPKRLTIASGLTLDVWNSAGQSRGPMTMKRYLTERIRDLTRLPTQTYNDWIRPGVVLFSDSETPWWWRPSWFPTPQASAARLWTTCFALMPFPFVALFSLPIIILQLIKLGIFRSFSTCLRRDWLVSSPSTVPFLLDLVVCYCLETTTGFGTRSFSLES